ncbi:hypothetical protein MRB53_038174 [Persea americana]|nr:hypothetical protein MRB53_038174 [Persea americana]
MCGHHIAVPVRSISKSPPQHKLVLRRGENEKQVSIQSAHYHDACACNGAGDEKAEGVDEEPHGAEHFALFSTDCCTARNGHKTTRQAALAILIPPNSQSKLHCDD